MPIFTQETIFENKFLAEHIPQPVPYAMVLILLVITIMCKVLLDLYLSTKSGYLLRAVGDNEALVTSLAKDKGMVRSWAWPLPMDFTAMAGSIYCQHKGF